MVRAVYSNKALFWLILQNSRCELWNKLNEYILICIKLQAVKTCVTTLAKTRRQIIKMKKLWRRRLLYRWSTDSACSHECRRACRYAKCCDCWNGCAKSASCCSLGFSTASYHNSAVPNTPIQSLAAPLAALPVVNADHALTVAAPPTVQSVVSQLGGAQRYDLRPRPKPSRRNAILIIVALILLLLLAAWSSPISPLVGVACNSKNTLNYWSSMWSVLTSAALVVPLILALITLIRLIIKSVRQLLLKYNLASLATPSKVIKESVEAQEVCWCGRIDSKDPH